MLNYQGLQLVSSYEDDIALGPDRILPLCTLDIDVASTCISSGWPEVSIGRVSEGDNLRMVESVHWIS